MTRVRAAAAGLAFLVWALAAFPRQASNVFSHLGFSKRHVADSLGEIRREQYGPAFQEAIERIASEIPPGAEYGIVESPDPGCNAYWIRSALVPRTPRSLGPESALRPEDLRALTTASPRVFVVGCAGGAPGLLGPDPPTGVVRP
ncbi:MAG: hypothetical protein IPL89_05970 [Acidobacteria bacterium]|nr:hypothetical protein [Acidobacteriota bacterium]